MTLVTIKWEDLFLLKINYQKGRTLDRMSRTQTMMVLTLFHSGIQAIPLIFLPLLSFPCLGIDFSLPSSCRALGSKP